MAPLAMFSAVFSRGTAQQSVKSPSCVRHRILTGDWQGVPSWGTSWPASMMPPQLWPSVCQFTSPAALTAKTKAGMFYFLPGVGKPATLIIQHDQPRCVLASKFTLKGDNS